MKLNRRRWLKLISIGAATAAAAGLNVEAAKARSEQPHDGTACNVCGKSMVRPDGTLGTGVEIICAKDEGDVEWRAFMSEQFAPYEPDTKYSICFGCILAALGVQP